MLCMDHYLPVFPHPFRYQTLFQSGRSWQAAIFGLFLLPIALVPACWSWSARRPPAWRGLSNPQHSSLVFFTLECCPYLSVCWLTCWKLFNDSMIRSIRILSTFSGTFRQLLMHVSTDSVESCWNTSACGQRFTRVVKLAGVFCSVLRALLIFFYDCQQCESIILFILNFCFLLKWNPSRVRNES